MLQLMIDAVEETKGMSDKALLSNCFLFLVAGFETTATALSFAFYLFAKHQTEQQKVYEEIVAKYGKNKKEFSYDELQVS